MNYKFDLTSQPKPSESQQIDLSGLLSNIDKVNLENTLTEANSEQLASSLVKTDYIPQSATYITEIGDRFYLLDYHSQSEPKPVLIDASIAKLQQPPTALKLEESKRTNDGGSALFGRKGLLIGVGLGILLTLGATRIFSPSTAEGEAEPVQIEEGTAPTQTVTVAEVTTENLDRALNASGTVTAFERTPVMSQAGGLLITEVLAERAIWSNEGRS